MQWFIYRFIPFESPFYATLWLAYCCGCWLIVLRFVYTATARGICCHFVVGDVVSDIMAGLFQNQILCVPFFFSLSSQSIFSHLDFDFVYYSLRKSKCHHFDWGNNMFKKKVFFYVCCLSVFFFYWWVVTVIAKYWIISLNWKNLSFDERERSTFLKISTKTHNTHCIHASLFQMNSKRRNDREQMLCFYSFTMNGQQPNKHFRRDCAEFRETITWSTKKKEKKKEQTKSNNGTAIEKSIWIDYIGNECP